MTTALDIALDYIARGWSPIPVPFRKKGPVLDGWQHLRITAADAPKFFNGALQNIGVIMGPASSNLADVDLDTKEAVAVAPFFLPTEPTARFGRKSRRNSHWLYITDLAATREGATIEFKTPKQPFSQEIETLLVELRIGAGKGAQTVFPGSVHEDTSEAIEWERDGGGEPLRIDGDDLLRRVTHIAAASLLARVWPPNGSKVQHDAARVLGGFLARAGFDVSHVKVFTEAVVVAAEDGDPKNRITAAADAAKAFAEGKNTFGVPAMKEAFGELIAKRVAEWLEYNSGAGDQADVGGGDPDVGGEDPDPGYGEQPTGTAGNANSLRLICLADVEPEPVSWLWPNRLALGKLTIVAGDPGLGKSQIGFDIAARISKGAEWPDLGRAQVGGVLLLSAEDGVKDTLRPRLEAAGADLARVHVVKAAIDGTGKERSFNLQTDLTALKAAMSSIGDVVLIVIDPITSYMGSGIDSHRTTDVRGVLEPLAHFAEETGAAVLAVSHPPKAAQSKAIHAVTGSLAYVAAARIVSVAVEEPETGRRLLLSVKNNLGPKAAGLGYALAETTIATKNIVTTHVVWDGEPVTMTADEAMRASGRDTPDRVTEAKDFLREELAAGPALAADLIAHAARVDISERTLRRARKLLGVTAYKEAFAGPWIWSLPA